MQAVGLFVNEEADTVNEVADLCRLDLVQLHGDEPPDYCRQFKRRLLKAFRVRSLTCLDPINNYQVAGYLLDTFSPSFYGGTGLSFNWEIAAEAVKRHQRIVLAGGLTPDNVAEAISQVRPYGVDVSSGVEAAPGKKDRDKLRAFLQNAKEVQS